MAEAHQDSFDEYKKYLEQSLGIGGVPLPPRPMTPYLRFYFERTCEEKSKGNKKIVEMSRNLGEEWKNLDAKKKQYYVKTYEIRIREKEELQEEYDILMKKKKQISGYSRYYKLRFRQLQKENPKLTSLEIGEKATGDWKNLSQSQKQVFIKQAAEQKANLQLNTEEREARLQDYKDRVKRFEESLKEDKFKILKKYGLEHLKEKIRAEKEKKANAKILQKQIERVKRQEQRTQKRNELKQQKLKQKEEQKKKKEEQRQLKKEEEKKKREAQAEKKKQSRSKSKAANKEPKVKKQVKKTPKKTKQIKKAPKSKKPKSAGKAKAPKVSKVPKKKDQVKKEQIVQPKPAPKKQKKPAPVATRRSKRK